VAPLGWHRSRALSPSYRRRSPPCNAVALDTGESQRNASRISRARLQIVKRHFNHKFGTHRHDPIIPADRASQQFTRLPFEYLIGHALERFAKHRLPVGGREFSALQLNRGLEIDDGCS